MKIEVWSDFISPCCYIGKRKLEEALKKFPHHKNVFIEYKSFELDPDADQYTQKGLSELMARKYKMTTDEIKDLTTKMVEQAAEYGLVYDFDEMRWLNTFDAHRLAQYATKENKGNEMIERLLKAYFIESKHIGSYHILIELACEVGLDIEKIEGILESCKFTKNVRLDQEQAEEIGIQTVPFYVFNEKYAVAGVQTSEVFLDILKQVWEEENEEQVSQAHQPKSSQSTYCCEGESCTKEEVEIK